ncbi:MAG: hypothetical protein K6F63_10545 [Lachnospiraceae bacterium]|nr:hypothetical protein [Lachnospiraceae bacterium]
MELKGWKCFKAFAYRNYKIASVVAAVIMTTIGAVSGVYFGGWAIIVVGAMITMFIGTLDYSCISEFNRSNRGCMNFVRSSFWAGKAVEKYVKADIWYKTIILALGFGGCLAASIAKGGVLFCLMGFGLFLGALFFLMAFIRNKCLSVNVSAMLLEFGLMCTTAVLIAVYLLIQLITEAGFGLLASVGFTALSAIFAVAGGRTLYRVSLKNFEAGYRPTENL